MRRCLLDRNPADVGHGAILDVLWSLEAAKRHVIFRRDCKEVDAGQGCHDHLEVAVDVLGRNLSDAVGRVLEDEGLTNIDHEFEILDHELLYGGVRRHQSHFVGDELGDHDAT